MWWSKKKIEVEVGKATVLITLDDDSAAAVNFTGHAHDFDFFGLVITTGEGFAKEFVASRDPIEVSPGLFYPRKRAVAYQIKTTPYTMTIEKA